MRLLIQLIFLGEIYQLFSQYTLAGDQATWCCQGVYLTICVLSVVRLPVRCTQWSTSSGTGYLSFPMEIAQVLNCC